MKLGQKLRKIAHDLFFQNASDKQIEFTLTCRDVTSAIDLRHSPKSISDKFRFWVHLNICQACRNYHNVSTAFSKALRRNPSQDPERLDLMTKALLEKYGKSDKKK